MNWKCTHPQLSKQKQNSNSLFSNIGQPTVENLTLFTMAIRIKSEKGDKIKVEDFIDMFETTVSTEKINIEKIY